MHMQMHQATCSASTPLGLPSPARACCGWRSRASDDTASRCAGGLAPCAGSSSSRGWGCLGAALLQAVTANAAIRRMTEAPHAMLPQLADCACGLRMANETRCVDRLNLTIIFRDLPVVHPLVVVSRVGIDQCNDLASRSANVLNADRVLSRSACRDPAAQRCECACCAPQCYAEAMLCMNIIVYVAPSERRSHAAVRTRVGSGCWGGVRPGSSAAGHRRQPCTAARRHSVATKVGQTHCGPRILMVQVARAMQAYQQAPTCHGTRGGSH